MFRGDKSVNGNDVSRIGESLDLSKYSQEAVNRDGSAVIYFVLPKGTTEATCCQNMSLAYHMCEEAGMCVKWITEVHCTEITPVSRNIFVLNAFSGMAFDYLLVFFENIKFEIIGPQCIRMCLESKEDIPIRSKGRPMFTLAMQDIVITLTGFTDKKTERDELQYLIDRMNGTVSPVFTLGTTHIVADSLLTDKCKLAYSKEKPVMTSEWIRASWKDSQKELIQATDPKYVSYSCPIFYHLNICVSQIPSGKKNALKNIIEANGGTYFNELDRRLVNVLVIPSPGGEKYRHATQWRIPCVNPNWVEMCKSAGHILPLEEFSINGNSNAIKSSTPSKTINGIAFPDGSINMCSIIPNASRYEVEATFSSTKDESVDVHLDTDVLSVVKRASDEGPFLDGCKIYLCGSDTMEKVRKLLNGSGATRLNRLDERVTHVLVIGAKIPEDDVNRIHNLHPKPYLVSIDWLVESAKQGSPADEEMYCFNPDKDKIDSNSNAKPRKNLAHEFDKPAPTIAELVERKSFKEKPLLTRASDFQTPLNTPNTMQNKNVPKLPISIAELKNLSLQEDGVENDPSGDDGDLGDIPNSAKKSASNEAGVRALSQRNKSAVPVEGGGSLKESSLTMCEGEENDLTCSYPFAGIKFAVNLTVLEEKNDIEEIIRELNGEIVQENFDIVILPAAYPKEQNLTAKTCFTKYWVLDCHEVRTIDIPEAKYHQPLPKFKGMRNILEGVVIAVSQYGSSEKGYLATLAMEMGAEYQDVFSRKKTHNTQRSTHLICSVSENDKCTAANRWGVPVVTAEWIYDCYRNKKKLLVSNFYPGNKKNDSDSTISCIPVTPKAANSTNAVAQRLTAVTSVAFYPPSTSKFIKPIVNEFLTPKAVKRKSSEQNITPVSSCSISDTDVEVDSQTPVGNRQHSKANDSDLDLAPAKPTEESPLLWGLSREASRQLKRGFDIACSNSPGPDLASLKINFKKGPNRIPVSAWADLKIHSPRQRTILQNQVTGRLPTVRVSMQNKFSLDIQRIDSPQADNGPPQDEGLRYKRRKTSDSSTGGDIGDQSSDAEIHDEDQAVGVDVDPEVAPQKLMENVVVFISKKCENIEMVTDVIENLGGHVTTVLKSSELTHLLYQGKNAHMSKEVKAVSNSNVKIVDPAWIFKCQEKRTLLDENMFRPGKVVESWSPVKNTSNSKFSLDALENLIQQQDERVGNNMDDDDDNDERDTQGRTLNYKKMENAKAKDDDSEAEGDYNVEWVGDNAVVSDEQPQPKPVTTGKNSDNVAKQNEILKTAEKRSTETSEPLKQKKSSSRKDSGDSKPETEVEKTEVTSGKRVTRSRSVAQIIENPGSNGESTTSKQSKKMSSMKKKDSPAIEFGVTPVFMISALSDNQKVTATETIENLGGSISKEAMFDFNGDATIAGTLARSEKVLGSVASGKRLLKYSYISACKKSNKFVSPTEHAWSTGDTKNDLENQVVAAAEHWFSRISKDPQDRPYKDLNVFLATKKDGLTRLVLSGGGTICKNLSEANTIIGDKETKIPENSKNIQVRSATYLSALLFTSSTIS